MVVTLVAPSKLKCMPSLLIRTGFVPKFSVMVVMTYLVFWTTPDHQDLNAAEHNNTYQIRQGTREK